MVINTQSVSSHPPEQQERRLEPGNHRNKARREKAEGQQKWTQNHKLPMSPAPEYKTMTAMILDATWKPGKSFFWFSGIRLPKKMERFL